MLLEAIIVCQWILSLLKPCNCLKRKTAFGIKSPDKGWHSVKPTNLPA